VSFCHCKEMKAEDVVQRLVASGTLNRPAIRHGDLWTVGAMSISVRSWGSGMWP